jgi:hypothetical protein
MKKELENKKTLSREELMEQWKAGERQQQADIWADGVTPENLGTIRIKKNDPNP